MIRRQAGATSTEEVNPYGDHDDLDAFNSEGHSDDVMKTQPKSSLPWFLRMFQRRSAGSRRVAEQSAYMIDSEAGRESGFQE